MRDVEWRCTEGERLTGLYFMNVCNITGVVGEASAVAVPVPVVRVRQLLTTREHDSESIVFSSSPWYIWQCCFSLWSSANGTDISVTKKNHLRILFRLKMPGPVPFRPSINEISSFETQKNGNSDGLRLRSDRWLAGRVPRPKIPFKVSFFSSCISVLRSGWSGYN